VNSKVPQTARAFPEGPCLWLHSDDGKRSWSDGAETVVRIVRTDKEKQDAVESAELATDGNVDAVFVPVAVAFAAPDLLAALQAVEHFRIRGYTREAVSAYTNDDTAHPLWPHFTRHGVAGIGKWLKEISAAAIAKAGGGA